MSRYHPPKETLLKSIRQQCRREWVENPISPWSKAALTAACDVANILRLPKNRRISHG